MWALIKKNFYTKRVAMISYGIASISFVWMFIAMFPSFADEADAFEELIESYPEGMMKAFGIDNFGLGSVEQFLALEHYSIMWPLLMMFFMVSLASHFIAGETDNKTMNILLSQPISRSNVYGAALISGLISAVLITISSSLMTPLFATLHGVEFQWEAVWAITVLGFFYAVTVFSIALLASVVFSEKGKVAMSMGIFLLLMYTLDLVGKFVEVLEPLKYVSLWHYYDSEAALVELHLDGTALIVMATISVLCLLAGYQIIQKRDYSV